MIWIGIAIGIIFTSIFGMALLVIVSKQKSAPIPPELKEYWMESMRLQRLHIEGIIAIADGIKKNSANRFLEEAKAVDARENYNELIMAVGKKYAGESRHDTALRYIRWMDALQGGASTVSEARPE